MSRRRPRRLCARCQRVRPYVAKGLCESCYANSRRGPYVPTGVGRGAPGVPRTRDILASRLEEFGVLLDRHYGIAEAARRVGVSQRTGDRYAARLRERTRQETA